jgi:uncharacterized metal-binding protein YceD (DUF177 family)
LGKFELYKIDLKNLTPGMHQKEYFLENKFFADIDGDEVQRGKVNVNLTINCTDIMFDMNFQITGSVVVSCDRCLDNMELAISAKNRLVVKFGPEYAEESDELIIVPESEGEINLAWFIYEFIALSLPMKHVHPAGKCNKAMASQFKKHMAKSINLDDEFDDNTTDVEVGDLDGDIQTDPRWDALKDLSRE